MIDHDTVQRVLDRAEILDVVQDFVSLKKRGVNYLGLCPFHNEKTPSFTVSPSKGIFKCFGCGKAGNAVSFVMEHEHISFPETIKYLGKKYGIEVVEKEQSPEDRQEKQERESMLIVNSFAQKYFSQQLHHHPEGISIALPYFKERGFREHTIKKFQLGYCIDQWDAFTREAESKGYKRQFLVKTGLTIQKGEKIFDRFKGRIMFPIQNLAGKVIGFGGRILKKDPKAGKYLNSPDSEIYHKSNVLYGIYFAKNSIVKQDKCYMVEGYTDVISMVQTGIENVVASSGTSLTQNQIRLVKRFTQNLTFIYDGDPAGIKAALRGIDLVLAEEMNVKIVPLPQGEDPDSFARKHSSSEIKAYIDQNEQDFIRFKTRLLMGEAEKDPVQRARLIGEVVQSIAQIPHKVTRAVYIKECSNLLSVNEEVLYSEIQKIFSNRIDQNRRKKYRKEQKKQAQSPQKQVLEIKAPENSCANIEREIIRLLLNYGNEMLFTAADNDISGLALDPDEYISVAQYIIELIEQEKEELEFTSPLYRKVYHEFCVLFYNEDFVSEQNFIQHSDMEVSRLAAQLVVSPYQLSKIWTKGDRIVETKEIDLKEDVPKFLLKYKDKKIRLLMQQVEKEIKNNPTGNHLIELLQQHKRLKQINMILSKELEQIIVS